MKKKLCQIQVCLWEGTLPLVLVYTVQCINVPLQKKPPDEDQHNPPDVGQQVRFVT